jgi:hypothetical protein
MKPLSIACLAVLLFACVLPTEACGCTPALGIGTVVGLVRTSTGAPAVEAVVRVEARLASCDRGESSDLVDSPTTLTDSGGRYVYHLRAVSISDSACLRLVAHAAGAPTGDSAVVDSIRMRLMSSYHLKGWGDTVRVDFRLP